MSTTGQPSTVDAVRERALDRARAIVSAYAHAMTGVTEAGPQYEALALGAAFSTAGESLHAEADTVAEAKKRGWQSLSKDYHQVAARVIGIGQDLVELSKLDPPPPPEAPPINDVRAYLAGDTDTLPADLPPDTTWRNLPDGTTEIMVNGEWKDVTPHVRDWRAGDVVKESDLVPLIADEAFRGFPPLTDAELANEGIVVPAPHLAFMDPAPVILSPKEPFAGAFEHRRSYADLMRPVDPTLVPKHWSWSQLTGAEDCGLQHRLSRLENVPQQPQWANIGGSAFHNVTERFDRAAHASGGADRVPEAHPELLAARWHDALHAEIERVTEQTGITPGDTGQNYRASKGGKEGYTWWLVEGERMLSMYVDSRRKLDAAARAAGTLAVPLEIAVDHSATGGMTGFSPVIEFEYERPVPGPLVTLTVKGIIDRAYRCADGSIMLKDLKSGAGTPDSGQLGEYAWALVHVLNLNAEREGITLNDSPGTLPRIRGCFYDARRGLYTEPIDLLGRPNHPHEEYVYRYHAAEAQRRNGIYLPHKSAWCNGCSVRHACPVGGPTT